MTEDFTFTIGALAVIVGVGITLYNFVSGRTIKARDEGQWQGKVDYKLDLILGTMKTFEGDINGLKESHHKLQHKCTELESRLDALEKPKRRTNKMDTSE
jgi:hypothetical protein